jgi:hypothetical protein
MATSRCVGIEGIASLIRQGDVLSLFPAPRQQEESLEQPGPFGGEERLEGRLLGVHRLVGPFHVSGLSLHRSMYA